MKDHQIFKNAKCAALAVGVLLVAVSGEAAFGDLLKVATEPDAGQKQDAVKQDENACPKCNGTGSVTKGFKTKKCKACGGIGVVQRKKTEAVAKPVQAPEPVAVQALNESSGGSALDDITADALTTVLASNKGFLLLDVREPNEFSTGHLKGSVNIPVGQVANRIGSVCPDKAREIYVYCQSGRRSRVAAQKLAGMGYMVVHNVLGGVNVWKGELVK